MLTPTAVLPPPPFPTLRMIIILFFWDSFIFFSLSSIFGVGTCHGTVELKSLEVEEYNEDELVDVETDVEISTGVEGVVAGFLTGERLVFSFD